jgi:hypothetical protein
MEHLSITEEEREDLLQGLSASIHRLRNKIKNDQRHERHDYNRIKWREERMERARVLIEKISQNDLVLL